MDPNNMIARFIIINPTSHYNSSKKKKSYYNEGNALSI